MSRYPMTDPITIPPFPQNEKEVPCGLLFVVSSGGLLLLVLVRFNKKRLGYFESNPTVGFL